MRRQRPMAKLGACAAALAAVTALAAPASANGSGGEAHYEVHITNLTRGQWLTPPVVATHDNDGEVYSKHSRASAGVVAVAENGDVPTLVAELTSNPRIDQVRVAGDGPLGPGATAIVRISSSDDARRLSLVGMLICTNDGFAGLDSRKLPRHVGQTVHANARALDAGTEVNTERWADLVPPCAQLTGFGNQGGTGTSNPALAEYAKIHAHKGVRGVGDLVPAVHDWNGPVVAVSITRTS